MQGIREVRQRKKTKWMSHAKGKATGFRLQQYSPDACCLKPYPPEALCTINALGNGFADPPKSNWALPLDAPPYYGFAVTCGITFTFGGVRIDDGARVLDKTLQSIPGLHAAGELVGGLFYENYPDGSGLTSGAVFERRAGRSAARIAWRRSYGSPYRE
jgi:FAD binding domain